MNRMESEYKSNQNNFEVNKVLKHSSKAFEPMDDIAYIIESLVPEASVSVWYGKFGTKKTFSALSASVAVALGKSWIGLQTKQSPVLFIDEESGERRLLQRIRKAIMGEKGDSSTPLFYTSLEGLNLLSKESSGYNNIEELIIKSGARLCFIDALADLLAGGDENSVKDTQPVFMQLRKLAESHNCAIILIHHTNKSDEYRGSSSIPGAVDLMLHIKSDNGKNKITLETIKNRDGEPIKLKAEIVFDKDNFKLVGNNANPFEIQLPAVTSKGLIANKIVEYMANSSGSLILRDYLEIFPEENRQSVKNCIYSLRKRGVIINVEEKSSYGHTVYKLVP